MLDGNREAEAAPLVSTVMATYNNAEFICQAIDSVLDQDYAPLELIIVDDGSTDGTSEVLEGYTADPRVKIVRQENSGQTIAKNRGISMCRGQYIAFCDSDDFWEPGKVSRQVEMFQESPRIGLVYGKARWVDEHGDEVPALAVRSYEGKVTAQLLLRNFITFCTVMVRREALSEVGGFDARLRMSIDYDAWLKVSVGWDFGFVPGIVASYRIWSGQMSHNMELRLDNAMDLMERFIADNPEAVSTVAKRKGLGYTHVTRGLWRMETGRRGEAARDFGTAAMLWPFDIRLWKSVAKLAVGRRGE